MIARMDPKVRNATEFVPQAILKCSPAFFVSRGIRFSSGLDDLNEYEVAELAVDGLPFALMRHEGTPVDETELYLPDSIPLGDVPSVVQRILRELDLPDTAVGWQRQAAETPF